MIKFSCKNCGQKLNVEDKHSGKRVKCPKCGSVGVVPANSDKVMFQCNSCGQKICVPHIHAGTKGKCPKCRNIVIIPSYEPIPTASAKPNDSIPQRTYQSQDRKEPKKSIEENGVNYRLILMILGAAVVIVGLIIWAVVIRIAGQQLDEILLKQTKIAFRSYRDGNSKIYIMNTDGNRLERLTSIPILASTFQTTWPHNSWSPTGDKMVFSFALGKSNPFGDVPRSGNSVIYVMNADGSKQTRLTNDPHYDLAPIWSPFIVSEE